MFSTTFNKGNGQAWSEAYKQVLKPELNVDYERLYEHVICNYSGSAAPKPAYLLGEITKHSIYSQNKTFVKNECPEFETLIAEKNGKKYEYGIDTTYNDTVKWLTNKGFTNIRFKFSKGLI